jgi:hypothetical protein
MNSDGHNEKLKTEKKKKYKALSGMSNESNELILIV